MFLEYQHVLFPVIIYKNGELYITFHFDLRKSRRKLGKHAIKGHLGGIFGPF